jgi:hypothetical protein
LRAAVTAPRKPDDPDDSRPEPEGKIFGDFGGGRGGAALPRPDPVRDRRRELEEKLDAAERELRNQALEQALAGYERLLAAEEPRDAVADHSQEELPGPEPKDDLVGGKPYAMGQYEAAGKLHEMRKMTVTGIVKHGLSRRRAHRIYRQYKSDAVVYDARDGVRPGSGYCWDPARLAEDPPQYRLIGA